MIRSMTGYGRAQDTVNGITVTAEIKSVNSRYLEFSPRVYRSYSFLEDKLKSYVQSIISRGKVDCSFQIEIENDDAVSVQVNKSLADGYYKALTDMCRDYGLSDEISVSRLASFPDVLSVRKEPADEDRILNSVLTVLSQAAESFVKMRETEGEKLRADILSRAEHILDIVAEIEKRSPETVREYNEKLTARIKDIIGSAGIDEQRILTEAAIYADKIAVDEETVRLRSHIAQLRTMLDGNEPIGRKLDFLVQEINREANTIGSKGQDIAIAKNVIEIKSEVEKIREQVQNIE